MSWIRNNVSKKISEQKVNQLQNNIQVSLQNTTLENIDAILYINLEHRTDRNVHILNEIHKICTDKTKIHRIDAIRNNIGILGCGLSHIKALEFFLANPEWNRVLILEDDFTFKGNDTNSLIKNINFLTSTNFDVALLSYNKDFLKYTNTIHNNIKRVMYSQTTSSYIINRHYINTLLNNFRDGVEDMKENGVKHENCIDIHWTKLQILDKWFTIFPALGYQYENYSDIEKKIVCYDS